MTESQYFAWCKKEGFASHFTKTSKVLQKEFDFFSAKSAKILISLHNTNDFRTIIKLIKDGTSPRNIKFHFRFEQSITSIYDTQTQQSRNLATFNEFLDVLLYFDKESNILREDYCRTLYFIVDYKAFWLRDYKSWTPKSHNPARQISSLLRHLFAKYDVPEFLDEAWGSSHNNLDISHHSTASHYRDWFIHIGEGQNIRTAHHLPFPFTKKVAHFFTQTPKNYSVHHAFLYALVLSEKGDERLVQSFINTKLDTNLIVTDMDFKLSTIRFFVANPMLDRSQIGPILDYVWEKKFSDIPDKQPNFSFNGRTVNSLLEQVERWHRQLNKERKAPVAQKWNHSKYQDFEYTEGIEGHKNHKLFRITELCSGVDLKEEGRAMHHCVVSYVGSCLTGRTTIWSLTIHSCEGSFRLLTLEVTNGSISQARGPYNRKPTQKEFNILHRWASKEHLSVSSYLG
ncbi:MAG: PcfJ domain-containing protein [Nitrosarchaeum sp.]|nr:PcfJ domain-containing protein [Nitrosarchaeum sp.]